jgi:hypothetical protein
MASIVEDAYEEPGETQLAMDVIDYLRLDPNGEYYTADYMTQLRHEIALDIIEEIDSIFTEYNLDCHQRNFDPISYLLSDAFTTSIPTRGVNPDPLFIIIKSITHPKHRYWAYKHLTAEKTVRDPHLWWRPISFGEAAIREAEGRTVPTGNDGIPMKRDTYFNMIPDRKSVGYMGAAASHRTVSGGKQWVVDIYYSVKFFAGRIKGTRNQFQPLPNNFTFNWTEGYSGNPNEKNTEYLLSDDQKLFGIKIESKDLKLRWESIDKREHPWSWASYKNLMASIVLMEHELHHAMIGRYFPTVMDKSNDLLLESDIASKPVPTEALKQIYLEQMSKPDPKQTRDGRKFTFGRIKQEDGTFHNAFTNTLGHNMWWGHFVYRSGMLGCEITINSHLSMSCKNLSAYEALRPTQSSEKTEEMEVDGLLSTLKIKF